MKTLVKPETDCEAIAIQALEDILEACGVDEEAFTIEQLAKQALREIAREKALR